MNRLLPWLPLALTLALAGCGDGGDDRPPDPDAAVCDPGALGCDCLAGACDGALVCLDGTCQPDPCPAGADGCACLADDTCDGDLACADGTCQPPPPCPEGDLGCACAAGECNTEDGFCDPATDTCQRIGCPMGEAGCACGPQRSCGQDLDGAPLACVEGICVAEGCAPGRDGCACRGGFACDDAGTSCVEGHCMSDDCVAGQRGCLCAAGTCDLGLRCRGGAICVDATGALGGACFADGTCDPGHRCEDDTCVACARGSEGCHCRDDGGCNDGLGCDARGLCQDPRGLAARAPGELRCYTPCATGVQLASGRFVECPADGLLAGCFGDTACTDGQCLAPGDAPALCLSDVDCPDFQTCLIGRCVSNCDTAADCVDGAVCHRHVCRRACTVSAADACGPRQHCQLQDGDNGFCRQSVPPTDGPAAPIGEPFTLSLDALDLGNPEGRAELHVTNNTPVPVDFTLTRQSHLAFAGDGDRDEVLFTEGCEAPHCPLWWVEISVDGGAPSTAPVIDFTLDAGATLTLSFDEGRGFDRPRWQGAVELATAHNGVRALVITRSATPTGQWTGESYVFGNFKDAGLDAWIAAKDDPAALEEVENAFVRLWGNFRQGRLSFAQFQAGLVATRTESWRSRRLAELGCGRGSVCYPFDNFDGFLTYTTDPINVPVPSGVVEMPMALNIRPAAPGEGGPDCDGAHCFVGRIQSPRALQYAGLPQLALAFASDPAACADRAGDECLTFVSDLVSELTVGARYHTTADDTFCDGNPLLRHARMPWLLPGFIGRSERDDESGRRYTYSCLDTEAPLPGANPVPDGRLRYRTVELIDGALIDNNTLFILYRERLETFLWEEPNANNGIEGYGYFLLRKSDATLPADDFRGFEVPRRDNRDRSLRPIHCTDETLAPIGLSRRDLEQDPARYADTIARAVVDGVTRDLDDLAIVDPDVEAVHYLCEDTGLFDGGPGDDRVVRPDARVTCPEGSRVTFFTLSLVDEDAPLLDDCGRLGLADCHQAWLAARPCQQSGTCGQQLDRWLDDDRHGLRLDPYFRCEDPNRALCNDDRRDLTRGKVFFAAEDDVTVFRPIRAEIADAFRYRTRFVNRSGNNLGFVPEICIPGGDDLVPYCYDPDAIEALRTRVECALELYTDHFDALSGPERQSLRAMLIENFASAEEIDAQNQSIVRRGFEFLDAELMIMLGDEHYTRALASRFDLAQNRVASFEGDLFEQDGIRLSGVAGAEMHALYTAVQYYQSTLDRFYDLSPIIAGSVKAERERGKPGFITTAAVESYFGRLIRASTQKARAWADISERYQNFGRPDLARRVIERSYTASYLESMILTRLMQEIVDITAPEEIAQLQQQIEDGQRTYRVALAVMRQHYADISDDLNYFGFAPDFIPFPALEGLNDTSFEVARQRALDRITLAQAAETLALEANQSFNTDTASFQNELARIGNTYDAQLADLCGTFDADGRVFPATARYAHQSPATLRVGDPCGIVGNGQIHQAMGDLDITLTEMRRVRQAIANTHAEAAIEEARWNASCRATDAFADFNYATGGVINNVQTFIDGSRTVLAGMDRLLNEATTIAAMSKCSIILGVASGGDCPTAGISIGVALAAFAAYEGARVSIDLALNLSEREIRDMQREVEFARDRLTCDLTAIDGEARVRTILLRLAELKLEALKAEYQVSQAISQIQQLRNQATRLQQEQAETEALTINVEAARNNPNVRIYRNDAILNADVTFYSALREVYKATRVFEYYTSQSYGPLEQLFITRMVSRGDANLQLYLIALEDAFRDFEDTYGLPSRRLEILTLKDDILAIPRIDVEGTGQALTEAERTRRFRDALTDPRRLDENGYLTIPFSTSDGSLSPLTRNHKISHVEAEIIGGGQGDLLARVYLRMAGTSRVSALGSPDPIFYTFPERLAVINPFFEGSKPAHIDPDIYRNRNLFDRPLVNSRWEFVLNTLDESVNADLDLRGLDDVRLYIYYNDFTEF
ncbi:MAG: hypothetical protein H6701_07395 [Myxococcales bacterium]|nr:hypothetical protein [Myxococcales bacterium]